MQQPAFGERLRRLRHARGLSQRSVAGDIVTPSYVSLLESGRRVPTLDVVLHLARSLEVPASELLGHELEALAPPPDEPQASVLLAETLARNAVDFAEYHGAAEILQRALEGARKEGNSARVVDIGLRLQEVLAAMNDREGRVSLLKELLTLPTAEASTDLQLVLRTELAAALRDAGALLEAREAALLALEQMQTSTLAKTGQHVHLLGVVVSVMVELADSERISEFVTQLLEIAEELGSPAFKGRAHWAASLAYASMGAREEAEQHLTEARRNLTSPNMPLRDWLRFCRASASVLMDVGGSLDQAQMWLQSADMTARMLGIPGEQELVAVLQARYELAVGEAERSLEIVTTLLEAPHALSDGELLDLRLLKAQAIAAVGDPEEAGTLLRDLAADCEQRGNYQLAVQVWRQIDVLQHGGAAGSGSKPTSSSAG